MSDIDFDELDKAVNSLMQPKTATQSDATPKQDTPQSTDQPAQPVADQPTVDTVNAAPATNQPDTTTSEPATSTASAQSAARPSLATKRRGQFMDVMHPSANMKSNTNTASPTASRKGVSLQPMTQSAEQQPSTSEVSQQSPATTVGAEVSLTSSNDNELMMPEFNTEPDTATTDSSASQTVDATAESNDPGDATDGGWPDPIDMLDESDAQPPVSGTTEQSDQPTAPEYIDTTSSPFLPDAKVEKRPLGAVAEPDATSDADDTIDADETTNSDSSDNVTTPDSNADLPAELHASLMSLEGDDTSSPAANDDTARLAEQADHVDQTPATEPTTSEPSAEATQSADTADTPAAETESPTPVAVNSPSPEPLATPTKVEPKTAPATAGLATSLPPRTPTPAAQPDDDEDDSTTSIFNTDDQPLKHQPKHSSGWYTIMVFAGMVIVGVLGAVVFYMMTNNGI